MQAYPCKKTFHNPNLVFSDQDKISPWNNIAQPIREAKNTSLYFGLMTVKVQEKRTCI